MSATTRCKFRVDEIGRRMGSKRTHDEAGKEKWVPAVLYTIRMSPVYGNNDPKHENSKFWESSPTGSFELGTINESAAAIFEVGEEYYLDISKAPRPEQQ